MKSWRTSLIAIATSGFGFILFSPEYFAQWPWLIALAKYATLGGLTALGLAAKDATVQPTAGEVATATAKADQKAIDAANGK